MRVARVANISNTCTCKYVANRLLSKNQKQRRFKNDFNKIVLLLAFVGNARSIAPTRTLIFAGACTKPFAKIQQLVPTNTSTLVNTFSDQRRTCVQLRRGPTQLPSASWSARGEPSTIVSECFLMAARHLQ